MNYEEYLKTTKITFCSDIDEEIDYRKNTVEDGFIECYKEHLFIYRINCGCIELVDGDIIETVEQEIENDNNSKFLNYIIDSIDLSRELTLNNSIEKIYKVIQSEQSIGCICNYYGGLSVRIKDGRYQWSIENWDGHDWEEISKELYTELLKHNEKEDNNE